MRRRVYRYARAQLAGLQFAPFVYTTRIGVVYRWSDRPLVAVALAALVAAGWEGAAFRIFGYFLEVE
jgi:hypothetical protein